MNQKTDKKIKYLPFLIGLCMLLLIVMIISATAHKNPLEGKWNMDDVTIYEFGSANKGALLLPSTEYEFTYTTKDDVLYIDFIAENAKDASYAFQVNGDTLTFEGGNATTQGTYVLKKVQ